MQTCEVLQDRPIRLHAAVKQHVPDGYLFLSGLLLPSVGKSMKIPAKSICSFILRSDWRLFPAISVCLLHIAASHAIVLSRDSKSFFYTEEFIIFMLGLVFFCLT